MKTYYEQHGYGEDVRLSRLEVVYDGGEIAKPSLHINEGLGQ